MSFPRYPKYKPSGVEWLGEVPEHWEVVPVWLLFKLGRGRVISNEEIQDNPGPFPVYSSQTEGNGEMGKICSFDFDGDYLTWTTDGANAGTVFRRSGKFNCTNVCGTLLPNKESAILDYMVHAVGLSKGFYVRHDINPKLMNNVMGKIRVPKPPKRDQLAIASFLDHETAKIDALIAEQQRLIELLKEKRQAVISHAVTKGLDPTVRMKDSGVEWLGQVPEHWEVGPVKRFFESCDGRRIPLSTEERSYMEGEYPYYGASGIIDFVNDFIFDEDLVLVSEDGANLINRSTPVAFVAAGKYWVNNHAHILRPNDNNLHYWSERIESVDLIPFVTGSAQPKLTADALLNLKIAVPPTENERFQIQTFFLGRTKEIHDLILEAQRAIDLLQERRTALISAAVTGQIDVRGFQPAAA